MMRSVEKQFNLLIKACNRKYYILEKIKAADLYYEEDREDFIDIISANDFEYSWNTYANLDTAAREDLMDLLEKEVD